MRLPVFLTSRMGLVITMWLIYLPTHALAFYVYYNPPKDAWYWVNLISTALPQLGGLMEFKKMPVIGARLAFMFAVTYVPMLIVGLLLAYHSSFYGKKVNVTPKKSTVILGIAYFALVLVLLHYLMYWTTFGKGHLSSISDPSILALLPILGGGVSYLLGFAIHKFFQIKGK